MHLELYVTEGAGEGLASLFWHDPKCGVRAKKVVVVRAARLAAAAGPLPMEELRDAHLALESDIYACYTAVASWTSYRKLL